MHDIKLRGKAAQEARLEADYSKQQGKDYLKAALVAPFAIAIIYVVVCGFLLVFPS